MALLLPARQAVSKVQGDGFRWHAAQWQHLLHAAPTEAGGQSESPPGKESQRLMGQIGLTSARTHEGKMPIGEAHGRPPDLPDPYTRRSISSDQVVVDQKAHVCAHQARRPSVDEGARTCPDRWPSLGIITIDPDI